MYVKFLIGALSLLPIAAHAANECNEAKSTRDGEECISQQMTVTANELAKYLEASHRRFKNEPNVVEALDKAQQAWLQFKDAHCNAIYEIWSGGTMRNSEYGMCVLEQTRRRTHDLWKVYLTFMDSTPPLLPEPQVGT